MGVRPGLRPVTGPDLARSLRALKLAPGYLLHVGTLEPRKNLEMLMRAYCGLPATVRERHPLVLAGGSGWKCEDVHDFLAREGRAKNVRWLGYVADDRFPALYSGARAMVFPTQYEGFGMPAVEAMACGCAVLASTTGAVAEVVGGRAHLIDPADEGGWRDAMLRACTDGEWLGSLRAGAEAHAARFTWARCAKQTLQAYRKALSRVEFARLTREQRGVAAPVLTSGPQVRSSFTEHISGSPGRS
jgi:alpha-1,3-rhamnosyl/mannosyltransferase